MSYLWAFLIGGLICGLSQLVLDNTNLMPAHVLVSLTMLGAILTGLGLYQPIIDLAGAGAVVPVSGFGNAIASGMIKEAQSKGLIGLFTGAFEFTGLGVTAAVIFGFIFAMLSVPED
jgi:stage V sporulation protein AE